MSRPQWAFAFALFGAGALPLSPAFAHSVCGDHIFPATLAIDDPGVNDELALPTLGWVPNNDDGAREFDASFAWTKTITPKLGISVSSGPTWLHPGGYGWAALDTEIKYNFFCVPEAEFMASLGFDVTWAGTGTGAQAGSGSQNTYAPVLNAGLGFGTLGESLKYLRPFAITAQFDAAAPGRSWTSDGDPVATTFDWGFTLQYSLPYFNDHVAQIDNGYLRHLIPIVELAFSTPIYNAGPGGQITTGAIQPGLIYEASSWQLAVEAVIPINGASGHGVGVVGELHFFLDDLLPNSLGRPIFPHGLGIAPGI